MKEFIVKENETFPYKGAVYEMPELIRCKDCKQWMRNPYRESAEIGICFRYKHISVALAKYETAFCSDAERKEDDRA